MPHWIPPRPQPRLRMVALPPEARLWEAGMAASLAVALSWGLGELALLLIG